MYTIPYFLKDLLKKRLNNAFSSFSQIIIDNIVSCLTNPNDKNKYISVISEIQEQSKLLIVKIIADIFESFDEQYKYSSNRKLYYNINKSNVSRTITTLFGEVTFKRTYYQSKIDNSLHFVLDEALNLPKNDRYDPIIKAMAINTYSKTNMSLSGQIIGEQLTDISNLGDNDAIRTIPRQSIFNWIKDWNNPKIKFNERTTPKIIYVMGDEKYIGCQNQENDIMIKSFVVFEGVEQVSKGRRRLVNRTIINIISKQPWIEFSDILFEMYDSTKIEKIYLLGDGANWIKEGIKELKMEPTMEIKHLLCEFHYKQAIHHITTDELEREILLLSVNTSIKKDFSNLVNEIIRNNPNRKEIIEKKRNYIINNYTAIKDMLASDIGSSMESHISHYVANMFGSRPKGYSTSNIQKYLDISNYSNNNFNVFSIYLNTYSNTESITLNEKEINYSTIEKNIGSNIPIINNGRCNAKLDALNKLAHGI